jgi:hypothetical protein
MLRAGFEPTVLVFESAETLRVLDRSATVIAEEGIEFINMVYMNFHVS